MTVLQSSTASFGTFIPSCGKALRCPLWIPARKARHEPIRYALQISPRESLERLHKDASHVRWALSIAYGAVFAAYASDFMKMHKLDHNTSWQTQGRVRRTLEYSKERGLNGIYTFPTTFVGSLADREARKRGHHY